ncbi:S9 family peptidase [Streptomyces silvisoli]|uniref:Prolyl oligopeptidase family serine peptidase n=1 Tax=Streptomyces silvisoli TaxID=3034235 RepID=A0ABT5ZSP9_9ACTN|nr:alpha/beta fold hydrolase [Streptomyces silvisoli]MDF3292615.1 prolyl oligopeptidase family serine peptidase [Streptomyces silvisoli]
MTSASRAAAKATRTYGVYRPVLPAVCSLNPDRMVYTGDAEGRCEIFAWDRSTGVSRQVTDRPQGTLLCAIDADAAVWWFDADQHGQGVWRVQDFTGGPHNSAFPDMPPGRPCGLALTDRGKAAVAVADASSLTVRLGRRGEPGEVVWRTGLPAILGDLAPGGDLLAICGPPHSAHAVTLVVPGGAVVATLSGAARRIWGLGFAPRRRLEPVLLVMCEDDGHYRLGTWRRATGLELFPWCALDTETTARWYPDGERVLLRQDRHGRSRLFTADLIRRTVTPVPVAEGTVLDAAPRADGDLHLIWTDAVTPPRTLCLSGRSLPGQHGWRLPAFGRRQDLWTPSPDGPVHTLVTTPADREPPHPLVLLVHGGPADHARDAYDPMVQSLVGSGFAVARVNYRGSTGYGPHWRSAYSEGVGHTQVADLVRVRAHLLNEGIGREGAIGLSGTSWGGYLVLLALGTHPGLWDAGVAVKPLADYATAFRHSTPALRFLDTTLFGGTPEQVPEHYRHASPSTYARAIRSPLLLVAARHDAKCPPEQIEAYLAVLREGGIPHELLWLDSGHDGYDGAEHVAVLERSLRFLGRALRPAPAPAPDVSAAH